MQNSFSFAHNAVGRNEPTLFLSLLNFATLPYGPCLVICSNLRHSGGADAIFFPQFIANLTSGIWGELFVHGESLYEMINQIFPGEVYFIPLFYLLLVAPKFHLSFF